MLSTRCNHGVCTYSEPMFITFHPFIRDCAAYSEAIMGLKASESILARCQQCKELLQDAFLDKHGVKLGFMSAFVKAAADALQVIVRL